MKKMDFINALADKLGVSKDSAAAFLKAQTEIVVETLKKDGEVQITGFGTFKVSKRAARTGVNPRTGAKISIPAMRSPKFTAGKTLKESI